MRLTAAAGWVVVLALGSSCGESRRRGEPTSPAQGAAPAPVTPDAPGAVAKAATATTVPFDLRLGTATAEVERTLLAQGATIVERARPCADCATSLRTGKGQHLGIEHEGVQLSFEAAGGTLTQIDVLLPPVFSAEEAEGGLARLEAAIARQLGRPPVRRIEPVKDVPGAQDEPLTRTLLEWQEGSLRIQPIAGWHGLVRDGARRVEQRDLRVRFSAAP